jgi:exodeoxyribonuclease VII small subunit
MAEKKNEKDPGFEKALERLETIVGEMESGTLSLEKMMACFEEGTGLVKYCNRKLNEVEKKIEVLAKKGDAELTEPFEAESEDSGKP